MAVLKGRLVPSQPTDFTGYNALVFFLDDTGNHRGASAPVDKDGRFSVELPVQPAAETEAQVEAQAPGGILVGKVEVPVRDLGDTVSIEVSQAIPTRIEAADRELGKRRRIVGRVLNPDGSGVPVGIPLMVFGKAKRAETFHLVAVTTTNASGYFGLDVPVERLAEAGIKVGAGDVQPLSLEDDSLPAHIVAVAGEPVKALAETSVETPRTPGHEDFEAAPGLYNEDRGGRCVNFSTPNRTLEEVPFFVVVRTTQPAIKGFVLDGKTKDSDPALVKALQDMLAKLDKINEKAFAAETNARARSAPLLALGSSEREVEIRSTNVLSGSNRVPLATARINVRDELDALVKPALTDAKTLSKAFGFLPDQPHEVAYAIKGVANTKIRDVVRAAAADEPGRVELDETHRIDWDDTPTIYQATEVAHGHLLTFKQVWKADGYSLGDLLYSLPLAPGQKKLISTLDWDRTETQVRIAERRTTESFSASLARDRDISETISTALGESMRLF